jgi:2-aminomuconate deaminase|tara:strand:- start:276 stop:716 length:441 start_codon:yes stop_codon:yes gene_type:complete
MSDSISTNNAPKPVGSYPHARRVGDLLFLSGVGPRIAGSGESDSQVPGLELSPDGRVIKYNMALQVHAVFANVKAVLEASGSSWEELVDVTVFLTNMAEDFAEFNRIYAEYFSDLGDNRPCRTTLEVNCLPTPIAIELKCIATIKR